MKLNTILLAGAAMLAATGSQAQVSAFDLTYTTVDNDNLNPPVKLQAILTAAPDPYTANGYIVQSITGTRGGQAITGLVDPFSEFYFPATVLPGYQFATFLDSFGITFSAGGSDYQLYRNQSDSTFYHEFENPDGIGTGRLINASAFSIEQTSLAGAVPEPATWALMVLGFGMVGFGLRSRRKVSTKVSFA